MADDTKFTYEGADRVESPGSATVSRAARHTLRDLTRDFVLFTPALINTHGHFDRDPVQEFQRLHPSANLDDAVFCLDSDWPLFQGIGQGLLVGAPVNWDHRIYGVTKARWPLCRDFITAIGIVSRKRQFYARIAWHDLVIVDPLALHQAQAVLADIPVVQVVAFAVSSNRQFTHLQPAVDPPRTRAFPIVKPAVREIILEAEAALSI